LRLRRWLAPFALPLAAITLMVALMVIGFIVGLIDDALGKPKWFDVVGALASLAALAVLFSALRGISRELYEEDGAIRPRWQDHLRHAALLYVVIIGLVGWAITTRPMDMFGIAVFFPLAALLGVAADYSVLRSRRRDAEHEARVRESA
jgi:small basic protein